MGWRNPLELSEFEIHAEAFFQLKRYYKNVRGEFHHKDANGKKAARFDIAILDSDNKIQLVVEVKRANKKEFAKQVRWYEELTHRPCVVLAGMDAAKHAVSRVFAQTGMPNGSHPDIYREANQLEVARAYYAEFGQAELIIPS